ncbi:TetR-like C-terminal domain-containing protein, partial [Angustibacter aerolatus]
DELADRAAAAVAGLPGRDALLAVAAAYRGYAVEHPGRYAATQLELRDPLPEVVAAGTRHADLTRAVLRGYRLAEPDETDAVRLLHSTLHGFVSLERAGGFDRTPRPADASWARAVDALDTTFRTWAAAV